MPHDDDDTPSPRPAREWDIPPMDHGPGWKDCAFTWAMGDLILRRIADGESVRAITADARMPAYCTVFRWMRVVPEFGDAVAALRAEMARGRLAAREAQAVARRQGVTDALVDGRRVRWWVSGRKSTYTLPRAAQVLAAIEDGASLSEIVARPGMPSFKAWYRWLKVTPGLAAQYAEACRRREVRMACERDLVIERVSETGIPAANAALRAIDGRRGRLRPKTYRTPPPTRLGLWF